MSITIVCSFIVVYGLVCFLIFKTLIIKKGKKWIIGKKWPTNIIEQKIRLLTKTNIICKAIVLLNIGLLLAQVPIIIIKVPKYLYWNLIKSNFVSNYASLTIILYLILVIKVINSLIYVMKQCCPK